MAKRLLYWVLILNCTNDKYDNVDAALTLVILIDFTAADGRGNTLFTWPMLFYISSA